MDIDFTRVMYDHFIPKQTLREAAASDLRRAKRILYYTKMYKKHNADWSIRKCLHLARQLVDALIITERLKTMKQNTPV